VIALDSSVVVASFGAWHEHHDAARAVLADGLYTLDRRALENYQRCDVPARLLK
jgi:predicted nucleic acid-binding protein